MTFELVFRYIYYVLISIHLFSFKHKIPTSIALKSPIHSTVFQRSKLKGSPKGLINKETLDSPALQHHFLEKQREASQTFAVNRRISATEITTKLDVRPSKRSLFPRLWRGYSSGRLPRRYGSSLVSPLCFNVLSIWTTTGTCLTPTVLLLPKYKFSGCLR